MDRLNIINQDPRGFLYNVDSPYDRFSMDIPYLEYVQTYTDLEFEADIFLNYRGYVGVFANNDANMDIECMRRFGKHVDDVIQGIREKIKYSICAEYVLAGYITNQKELSEFIEKYKLDRRNSIIMRHSYCVAEKMKDIVLSCKDIDFGISSEDAFRLGFVHDIGYELLDNNKDDASKHNILGGQFLEDKFKYWKEVYYHGEVQNEYDSNALFLLNYCDMTTDMNGRYVSMDVRIRNIVRWYGDNPKVYEKACAMKKFLESDDRFKKVI